MTPVAHRPIWRAVSTFVAVVVLTGAVISAALFFVTVRSALAPLAGQASRRLRRCLWPPACPSW